jgi:hypothetical protein
MVVVVVVVQYADSGRCSIMTGRLRMRIFWDARAPHSIIWSDTTTTRNSRNRIMEAELADRGWVGLPKR